MSLSFTPTKSLLTLSMLSILLSTADAEGLRSSAPRIREASGESTNVFDFASLLQDAVATQQVIQHEEDEVESILELMAAISKAGILSMEVTSAPTSSDSAKPSVSMAPSTSPSASSSPASSGSGAPSPSPSESPTLAGGGDTSSPSASPSVSNAPSSSPSTSPTVAPTLRPSGFPTNVPTESPTVPLMPSVSPSAAPTSQPSASPSEMPSLPPTLAGCGITPEERAIRIMAILDTVANPIDLRDVSTIQGQAADWLINHDEYVVCPEDPKLVQRFALAVTYFATNGNEWLQCSANGTDFCGLEDPFVGASRFLSAEHECEWAGISCDNTTQCVYKIEFELNNLRGTIPTEIALLADLRIWGMERGGLTGQIPTEVGLLKNLTFIDLDFNDLTGSLSSELLSLSSLTQLDLNDNDMTGSIEGIGVLPNMEFLQLHSNFFTGTVPTAVGSYSNLAAFTLHETGITGTMPQSVCGLLRTAGNGGVLESLIADCDGLNPDVVCNCCTDCRA